MRFFKDNSYDIVKLFINQVGIAIFSMMLYTSISLVDLQGYKTQLYVAISVFSIAFYFALLYTAAWEFGAKERIRVDGGKTSENKFKGGLLALFANIPNFVLAGLALLFVSLYLFGGIEGFNDAFALINLLLRLIMSTYLGVIKGIFSFAAAESMVFFYETIGYLVAPIFAIGVIQLGFSFGYREYRISSIFSGKNNSK